MKITDRTDREMTLEIMATVEAHRMGLWYMMMQRQQGHIAHHVLNDGFRVIEYLRDLEQPLTETRLSFWRDWTMVRLRYIRALTDALKYATAAHMSEQVQRKISNHMTWLGNLGCMECRPDGSLKSDPPFTDPVYTREHGPCTVADSQAAGTGFPTTSSAAATTGIGSQGNSGAASGGPGEASSKGESQSSNSLPGGKPSSTKLKRLLGTGHPKRPNPYTRPKKGKG